MYCVLLTHGIFGRSQFLMHNALIEREKTAVTRQAPEGPLVSDKALSSNCANSIDR